MSAGAVEVGELIRDLRGALAGERTSASAMLGTAAQIRDAASDAGRILCGDAGQNWAADALLLALALHIALCVSDSDEAVAETGAILRAMTEAVRDHLAARGMVDGVRVN